MGKLSISKFVSTTTLLLLGGLLVFGTGCAEAGSEDDARDELSADVEQASSIRAPSCIGWGGSYVAGHVPTDEDHRYQITVVNHCTGFWEGPYTVRIDFRGHPDSPCVTLGYGESYTWRGRAADVNVRKIALGCE